MLKQWLLRNLIGVVITAVMLLTTFGLIISLLNASVITNRVDHLQLRNAPSRTAKPLASLNRGARLIVLDKQNGWYKVRRDDNKDDSQTGWIASWVAESTTIKTATPISEATIVLDPGHGGWDPGAKTSDGKHFEKTYTLIYAKKLRKVLENAGARVIMTRNKDVYLSVAARPVISNKAKADAFISFHFDSTVGSNVATGVTQYYYHTKNGSLEFAQLLSKQLNNLPLQNRGVEYHDLTVTGDNDRPAVLLENGYINTDDDYKQISNAKYQDLVTQDVFNGLSQFIKNHTQTK